MQDAGTHKVTEPPNSAFILRLNSSRLPLLQPPLLSALSPSFSGCYFHPSVMKSPPPCCSSSHKVPKGQARLIPHLHRRRR